MWKRLERLVSSARQGGSHERKFRQRGTLMETLQQVMYAFYAVLMLAAAGIGVWFYKKRKENDR